MTTTASSKKFPFLFGRAFIEAITAEVEEIEKNGDFPSFSEGLSLRLRA